MRRLLVLVLLVALVLLALLCIRHHAPAIEAGIRSDAESHLAEAGFQAVSATADGRTVILEGTVPDEEIRRQAEARVRQVEGVGRIENRLQVADTKSAPPATAQPEDAEPTAAEPTSAEPRADEPEDGEPNIVEPEEDEAAQRGQRLQAEIDRILRSATIEFRTSKAELTADGQRVLDRLVEPLRRASGYRVRIEGHTDSRGNAESNLALSQARAQAVADYLIASGVESSRIQAQGIGAAQPIATNDTIAGRQRNRRIELRLVREN